MAVVRSSTVGEGGVGGGWDGCCRCCSREKEEGEGDREKEQGAAACVHSVVCMRALCARSQGRLGLIHCQTELPTSSGVAEAEAAPPLPLASGLRSDDDGLLHEEEAGGIALEAAAEEEEEDRRLRGVAVWLLLLLLWVLLGVANARGATGRAVDEGALEREEEEEEEEESAMAEEATAAVCLYVYCGVCVYVSRWVARSGLSPPSTRSHAPRPQRQIPPTGPNATQRKRTLPATAPHAYAPRRPRRRRAEHYHWTALGIPAPAAAAAADDRTAATAAGALLSCCHRRCGLAG